VPKKVDLKNTSIGHGATPPSNPSDITNLGRRRYTCFSAVVCPRLDFSLPPRSPQVVWGHWGEIELFSATLAKDGLAECDQPGKNSLKFSAMVGNWTRRGQTVRFVHFPTELSWLTTSGHVLGNSMREYISERLRVSWTNPHISQVSQIIICL